MDKAYQSRIEMYYRECERDYEIVWQLKDSMAVHYGYWDEQTLTHRQALWNMNHEMAKSVQVKSSDYVLDAGCGIGGTSFFLAKNIHCKVHGISISPEQIRRANAYRESNSLEATTEFSVQDYTQTNFGDETFDVVLALESVVHSERKADFLREAFRILKPGGRLILADYFLRPAQNEKERIILEKWGEAWSMDNFIYEESFCNDAKENGFGKYLLRDVTDHVFPSIKLMNRSAYPGVFISRLGYLFGKKTKHQVIHSKSGRHQFKAFKRGMWRYKILLAIKPPVDENSLKPDNYAKTDLGIEPYIDNEPLSQRFPVFNKSGMSVKNVAKRIMHLYLETGIRRADKWF